MEAPLLEYMRDDGVPIEITRGMNRVYLKKDPTYVSHSSTVKEKAFVMKEISSNLRSGHGVNFPLEYFKHLHRLWLSLLAAIPQAVRNPRLIYDFSSSGMNEKVELEAPKEEMRFSQSLHRLLD